MVVKDLVPKDNQVSVTVEQLKKYIRDVKDNTVGGGEMPLMCYKLNADGEYEQYWHVVKIHWETGQEYPMGVLMLEIKEDE